MSFGGQQQSSQPDKGSSCSIEKPSLNLLYKLNVPEQVGTNFKKFGTLLLKDKTGIKVDNIEDECRGRPDRINTKILQYWVQGKGLPVTWDTLVHTLRDCNLNELAKEIQGSRVQHVNPTKNNLRTPPLMPSLSITILVIIIGIIAAFLLGSSY